MCRHWWKVRGWYPSWARKLGINGFGLMLTSIILFVTVTTKFAEGGWVTSGDVGVCYALSNRA